MYPSGSPVQVSFQTGFISDSGACFISHYSSGCSCEKEQTQIPGGCDPFPRPKSKKNAQQRPGELQASSQATLSKGQVHGGSMLRSITRQVWWTDSNFALMSGAQGKHMTGVDWVGTEVGCIQPFAAPQIIIWQLK